MIQEGKMKKKITALLLTTAFILTSAASVFASEGEIVILGETSVTEAEVLPDELINTDVNSEVLPEECTEVTLPEVIEEATEETEEAEPADEEIAADIIEEVILPEEAEDVTEEADEETAADIITGEDASADADEDDELEDEPSSDVDMHVEEPSSLGKVESVTAAGVNAGHAIKVSWEAVSGARGYQIYRKAIWQDSYQYVAASVTPYWIDSDVMSNIAYRYRVRAYNVENDGKVIYGEYSSSYQASAVIVAILDAAKSSNGIKLTWSLKAEDDPEINMDGAAYVRGYQIYRKAEDESDYTLAASTRNQYWTDTTVSSKYYSYYVRAYVMAGNGQVYYGANSNVKSIGYISQVKGVSAEIASNGVNLKWNSISNIRGYQIWRQARGESQWTYLGASFATAYSDKTAVTGTAYDYYIRAYNKSSSGSVYYGTFSAPTSPKVDQSLLYDPEFSHAAYLITQLYSFDSNDNSVNDVASLINRLCCQPHDFGYSRFFPDERGISGMGYGEGLKIENVKWYLKTYLNISDELLDFNELCAAQHGELLKCVNDRVLPIHVGAANIGGSICGIDLIEVNGNNIHVELYGDRNRSENKVCVKDKSEIESLTYWSTDLRKSTANGITVYSIVKNQYVRR